MAGAIERYAKPTTTAPVLCHQVSYIGQLIYSMLLRGSHLHTPTVPDTSSEAVVPQSLKHYLSQRRRWDFNGYSNKDFSFAGANTHLITRIATFVEVLCLAVVYYHVFNTGFFFYGVATILNALQLLPLLLLAFTPSIWVAFVSIFLNRHLRRNWKELLCGFCIKRCVSPFMSGTIFSLVAKNLGSQVWDISGGTAGANVTPAVTFQVQRMLH